METQQPENGSQGVYGPPPPPAARPYIGLALGSGIARGLAHIGVLQVLEANNIRPSIVTGTSIGALVGGCYLAGKLETLETWARSLTRRWIFGYLDLRVRSAGLIGGKYVNALLDEHFGDMQIADLPQPLIAVATDMTTGHEVWLRRGKLTEALRASFAVPGIFPPVEIGGRLLVDGALVNPLPVSPCPAMGARLTIAIDLNADLIGKARQQGQKYQRVAGFDIFDDREVSPEDQAQFKSSSLTRRIFRREENNPSLFGVMISAMNIVQDRLTRSRLAGDPPDVHIKPQVGHIGLLEFERAGELIDEGRAAAERALPEILAAIQVLDPYAER